MNVEARYPPWWESRDTVSSPDSLKTVFHCLDLGLGSYCLGFGLCLDDHCLNLGLDLALTVLVLYLEIKTVQDTWRPTRCIIQHSMSLPVRWCATILSFNSLTFGHVCVFAVDQKRTYSWRYFSFCQNGFNNRYRWREVSRHSLLSRHFSLFWSRHLYCLTITHCTCPLPHIYVCERGSYNINVRHNSIQHNVYVYSCAVFTQRHLYDVL